MREHTHTCTHTHAHCYREKHKRMGAQHLLSLPFFSVETHNSETQEEHAGNYLPTQDRVGLWLQTLASQLSKPKFLGFPEHTDILGGKKRRSKKCFK